MQARNSALFSSNSDEWETPQDLYDKLDKEFKFDLDPCATNDNHKTARYYTKKQDGLKMDWGGLVSFVIRLMEILKSGSENVTTKAISLILS